MATILHSRPYAVQTSTLQLSTSLSLIKTGCWLKTSHKKVTLYCSFFWRNFGKMKKSNNSTLVDQPRKIWSAFLWKKQLFFFLWKLPCFYLQPNKTATCICSKWTSLLCIIVCNTHHSHSSWVQNAASSNNSNVGNVSQQVNNGY